MNFIIDKKKIKLFLNNNPIIAKLCFDKYSNLLYDETTCPYIFINYYSHKSYNDEDVIIPFYFTDFYQREYYYDDTSLKFTLRYELDGNVQYTENLTSGDHEVNFGKLSEGEHWYSLQVIDEQGRESRRMFNEILVVDRETYDITPEQTYNITEEDLVNYYINKNNSEIEENMLNNRTGLTRLFSDLKTQGYRKCILPQGTYRVNRCLRNGTLENKDCPIIIPTNFTVDMNNSVFKMHPFDDREYGDISNVENLIVNMRDCYDSHLINGTIEGNYFERLNDLTWADGSNAIRNNNGESDNGFMAVGCKFCSLNNITISKVAGYNVCAGINNNKPSFGWGERKGWVDNIFIENGIENYKEGYATSNLANLTDELISNNYITVSEWLGLGGIKGGSWDVYLHFYDSNDNFIESIKSYQYVRCRIPEGASKFRATIKSTAENLGTVTFYNMNNTKYFICNNCHWVDNRTCAAPSQVNLFAFLNCDFTRSGTDITPCEIDLEDGWEQQQDIFIKGCKILENVGTGDVIDNGGINHVFEDNIDMRFTIRNKVNGVTIRNNKNVGITNSIGYATENTVRIYNNDNINSLDLKILEKDFLNHEKLKVKIRNNKIDLGYADFEKDYYVLDNCDIDFTGYTQNYHIINSNLKIPVTNAYILSNVLVENSRFFLTDGMSEIKFSFCESDAIREYKNCTYYGPTLFISHNYFNSGKWNICVFEDTLNIKIFSPGESNNMGDIQFNNCIFKNTVTIELSTKCPNCYIQFNNCTFKTPVAFIGLGESNTEFNNCILPN